jgi:hypothetical protein
MEVLTLLMLMECNISHSLASTLVQVALDEGINLNTRIANGTGTSSNGDNNAPLALPVVSDLENFKPSNHLEFEGKCEGEGEGIQSTLHIYVDVVHDVPHEEHDSQRTQTQSQQQSQTQSESQQTQQVLHCFVGNIMLMKRLGCYDGDDNGDNGGIPDGLKQEIDNWTQSGATVGFLALGDGGDESGDDTTAIFHVNVNVNANGSNENVSNGVSFIVAFCAMDSVQKEARKVIEIVKTKYHCNII